MHSSFTRSVAASVLAAAAGLFMTVPVAGQVMDLSPAPRTSPTPAPGVTPRLAPSPLDTRRAAPRTPAPAFEDESPLMPREASPEADDWFNPSTALASRGPVVRLASVPNMFGDAAAYRILVSDFSGSGGVSLPPPGGGRGTVKISENDKAMPMDRVFFSYNHFHNAMDMFESGQSIGAMSINQYTLGAEKTFRDGLWSVEMRLPLNDIPGFDDPQLTTSTGDVGNLNVTVKRLLLQTDNTAIAMGLGIDTPTGSSTFGHGVVSPYAIHNDALHLAPFLGFLRLPSDRVFYQGFLQVDAATNDNRVVFGGQQLGELHEQTLFFADLSVGYWLYRNECGRHITGVAPVIEYHYSGTLQDADMITGTDGNQVLSYGNPYNRMDVSNMTVGLHTEMGLTTIRVGGVFPLSTGTNRCYDAELQISVNRQF